MTLEEAIEAAAKDLPPGAEITVTVEHWSAWVDASDSNGNRREFDSADMSLPKQVADCIKWCKEQEHTAGDAPKVDHPVENHS